ncbi:DUF1722 domain-containing protein [Streptococcus ictaluri]|uniref:DUF1722 domain-containing protein n=1 Tax=Streptococcus ictaluri 707-05 TaxID=764299 RepID=G5K3Y4_9STRE|nr:DUF1722 domain-containing protein [Streptococcus ictaluri]EHI69735.1 hypothetical protein STRIC_1508 [Streptococcus ictaluri 707-05]
MSDQSLVRYQQEWAYQKYWVMAHSQQIYQQLRLLFRYNDWSSEKADQFNVLIQEAESLEPNLKTLRVAYQHVWGYFKKIASSEEKAYFKELDEALVSRQDDMLYFLQEMTSCYQPPYLLNCRLMTKGL